ncbi:MAG TPA: patatin-like protein [Stellaceae bacterium]|nr:patatin-like protein [Stellaceae bacterium]
MREKELRIALVCFGGISLAVYIHGVCKEILKLVRASSALHDVRDRGARVRATFADSADPRRPFDTEAVYFELLREIGRKIDLRVVVDIIAGASAGGINGTMLARALAHDLPMDGLRDLWLKEADVTELLAEEARPSRWSKPFMHPFIWGYGRWGLGTARLFEDVRDPEVRRKLSLFVRARWFKPPFDGPRMAQLMYDAVASMGEAKSAANSLLPAGQRLDLFVTLTDHYGYRQLIETHDPPMIEEREHRHILQFSYRRWPNGDVETDFDFANAPALAFAARATSSFPGAFPPAQMAELERLLSRRLVAWPRQQHFLQRNFEPYLRVGLNPRLHCFIDGSVLNDKPFREAIQAIKGRPAYRQVDRRLVYVDADPDRPQPPLAGLVPGFFTTLRSALSDIPRNEPIADELVYVNGFNERVRRLKGIIDAARPRITQLVSGIVRLAPGERLDVEQLRGWREQVNDRVAREAGFAYEGYVRLKLTSVRAMVAQLVTQMLALPPRSPAARSVAVVIDAWCRQAGVGYDRGGEATEGAAGETPLSRWVGFLLAFDIDFRKRRLYFLIQGQNRLYQMLDESAAGTAAAGAVDRLKRDFYQCLDALRHREQPEFFGDATRAAARSLFAAPITEESWRAEERAELFARQNTEGIAALIGRMAAEIYLDSTTYELDALLAGINPREWPEEARAEVLVNYLGFPFWDVLTLSVTNWRDVGEFDEILVDRISPRDARALSGSGIPFGPKGSGMAHFAAFFSRGYRENDYLLGRLHGIDRLIDIVCNAAGIAPGEGSIDIFALKRRAFALVLDAEERHLPQSGALLRALRDAIAAMGAG